MSLSNIVIPRRTIQVPGSPTPLTVRGLSSFDLSLMLTNRREDFMAAIGAFQANQDNPADTAVELVRIVPTLVALGIALAADEPEAVGVAAQLPAPIQIQALLDIADLTVSDPGALPNLVGRLRNLVAGAAAAARVPTPSLGS